MRIVIPALICVLAVVAAAGVGSGTPSQAGVNCSNSFESFNWLTGTWDGSWENLDFHSMGDVSIDATLNEDCTGQATIDGIFGVPTPQDVTFLYLDVDGGAEVQVPNDPYFGNMTIEIAENGDISLGGTFPPKPFDLESVTGTGTFSFGHIHLDYTLVIAGATPSDPKTVTDEEMDLYHVVTLLQGDIDCSGAVDGQDALKTLIGLGGGEFPSGFGCFDLGEFLPPIWGDVNCDGMVDEADLLALLRDRGGLPVDQAQNCTPIGDPLALG